MIILAEYSELKILCWNRNLAWPISREDAWGIYSASWMYVDQDLLTDKELRLLKSLEDEFGNGKKLVGTVGELPAWLRRQGPPTLVQHEDEAWYKAREGGPALFIGPPPKLWLRLA